MNSALCSVPMIGICGTKCTLLHLHTSNAVIQGYHTSTLPTAPPHQGIVLCRREAFWDALLERDFEILLGGASVQVSVPPGGAPWERDLRGQVSVPPGGAPWEQDLRGQVQDLPGSGPWERDLRAHTWWRPGHMPVLRPGASAGGFLASGLLGFRV
eukprot:356803-Chlamydomonas_euryale.AAC.2